MYIVFTCRIDVQNVAHLSIHLPTRQRQRVENVVVEQFKFEADKYTDKRFVVFQGDRLTQVIRREFADKVLAWSQQRTPAPVLSKKQSSARDFLKRGMDPGFLESSFVILIKSIILPLFACHSALMLICKIP